MACVKRCEQFETRILLGIMKLTDDQMVQSFCAALNATIQADALTPPNPNRLGTTVERASQIAAEAIVRLIKTQLP